MTTIFQLLRDGAERHGNRPAILFEEKTVSYGDLFEEVRRFAAGLSALDVGEHDIVASVMDNSWSTILAWLGVNALGAADVPINPQYRGELLHYLLQDSGATAVICDAAYLPAIVELGERLPSLRLAIVHGEAAGIAGTERLRIVPFDQVDGPAGDNADAATPERIILYTSGTTGPSKGVIHTQRSSLVLSRYNAKVLQYGPEDRLLNFFPLYHQNARYTGVLPALCTGASIRMERRFSSSNFWNTCRNDGTTAFNYLGSVLRMILNVTPDNFGPRDHTLRKAFGAGAAPAIWKEFDERLGIKFAETYGLTEAPMSTINDGLTGRPSPIGSAGRATELFEIAVVDEADNFVAPGTIGEIVMRPRQPDVMMAGYLNKDAATVAAFRNLWFHSGDRGRLSAEGDLYFEERGKDSIRRRGENISAWEVESILDQHPDVAESAVYGVKSDEADEEVCAAIVLKRTDADLREIIAFAQARLPRYAVPTLMRVLADLPRTPTEKVQKAELRKEGRKGCVPVG
jgi:crotonobetaine/carnitine-CoA ligase